MIQNFNVALKLLFEEVHKQKVAGLELLLQKRIKQVSKVAQKDSENLIDQLKARIKTLKNKGATNTYEDAIKWLAIDEKPIQLLRVQLNKKKVNETICERKRKAPAISVLSNYVTQDKSSTVS